MESPTWQAILKENFHYDHFANSAWLSPILAEENEEATKVFKHILAASQIWVTRLDGVSLSKMPDVAVSLESLDSLRDRWLAAANRIDYLTPIDYRNTMGQPYTRTFGDIARHAMNHGTYHRGQIRQIFGSQGLEFPETDYISFAFKRDEA